MQNNVVTLNLSETQLIAVDAALTELETQLAGLVALTQGTKKRMQPMGEKSEAFCRQALYIPDPNHPTATPIRYVRVNFHIMQGGDGGGNFNEVEGRRFVKELVNQSNIRWSTNQQMNLPVGNSTEVIPIPIRLVLQKDPVTGDDAIYFHRDDTLGFWNRSLSKGPGSLNDRTVIDKYRTGGDSIINIFLIEHHPDSINSPTYGEAKLSGISFIHSVKIFSTYYQYTTVKYRDDGTPFTHDIFYLSKLLSHELGHSFNLNHTWNWDDGFCDTPKNPGCWRETGQSPCEGPISNNMMDYNWNSHHPMSAWTHGTLLLEGPERRTSVCDPILVRVSSI